MLSNNFDFLDDVWRKESRIILTDVTNYLTNIDRYSLFSVTPEIRTPEIRQHKYSNVRTRKWWLDRQGRCDRIGINREEWINREAEIELEVEVEYYQLSDLYYRQNKMSENAHESKVEMKWWFQPCSSLFSFRASDILFCFGNICYCTEVETTIS